MKIINLKVMRGPNIWSNYRQRVVIMTLDLQELEKRPTHRIEGFAERIREALPSLFSHRCSEGNKGGFFQRVEQGTWMGHVIEHIALELQTMAGMFVGYGRTRSTDREGVYHVVFAYRLAEAGLYAARAAVKVADALVRSLPCDIDGHVTELKKLREKHRLSSTSEPFTAEADDNDIPYHFVNDALLLLGHGLYQARVRGSLISSAANISMETANSRALTSKALRNAFFAVLPGAEVSNMDELRSFAGKTAAPFLIKPLFGTHGRRIALPFSSADEAGPFLEHTLLTYRYAYAETFREGELYRILLIGRKPAAMLRVPRFRVVGDGITNLHTLVASVLHDNVINALNGYDADLVLPAGTTAWINGEPEVYDGPAHQDVLFVLERAAATLDLDCCVADVIGPDISLPAAADQAKIVAVDPNPLFTEFTSPSKGYGQNVMAPLFKLLFPGETQGKIPVIAIRGNGESQGIASFLSAICRAAAMNPGCATSGGLSICGYNISTEDCTDRTSIRGLLFDPCIDTGIVECSTQVILSSGLPFDSSYISIITGSRVKKTKRNKEAADNERKCDMVVGRTTEQNGFIILNADNDCEEMAADLYGKAVLYTTGPENETVMAHCSRGGTGAIVENGIITLMNGKWKMPMCRPEKEEQDGAAPFQCRLPAMLAAFLLNVPVPVIAENLMRQIETPQDRSVSRIDS